jgi:hypothetical protein
MKCAAFYVAPTVCRVPLQNEPVVEYPDIPGKQLFGNVYFDIFFQHPVTQKIKLFTE